MSDLRVYEVWIQQALGAGSVKPKRILELYKSLPDFYEAGRRSWRLDGFFTERDLDRLSSYTLSKAEALLEYCEKLGLQVITPDCTAYPTLLKEIHSPPRALYVKGELPDFNRIPAIAVVGTRKASPSGKRAADLLSFDLASAGIVVVSGGALGVDSAAHQGALRAGGKTVCVLGCGIGYPYLMKNAGLRECISQSGALLSEYPPDTPATSATFPIRNRIISGLSVGVLVVEAAAKSGSLITANCALEQGRDVFAVPNEIFSPVSQGVNHLLQCGAKPVCQAQDIVEEYLYRFPGTIKEIDSFSPVSSQTEEPSQKPSESKDALFSIRNLSVAAGELYQTLTEEPQHLSRLTAFLKRPVREILSAVTELELAGGIQAHAGRRYSLPS